VLVTVDLGGLSWGYLRKAEGPLAALVAPRPTPLLRAIAMRPGTRALALDLDSLTRSNAAISMQVRSVGGAHGTPPLFWGELVSSGVLRTAAVQRAIGVGVCEAPAGMALPDSAYERLPDPDGASVLWALRRTQPRAYAVRRVESFANDIAALTAMVDPRWDPSAIAVTTEPAIAGDYPGSTSCVLRWRDDAPDHQALDATASSPAFVVIADAWDRGWSATVDGAAVRLARVDHLLRGITVGAGTHRIALAYRPPGWTAGLVTGRITFALVLVLLVVAFALRGSARTVPAPAKAPVARPARRR
jgi:hypothetical protein